MVSLNALLLKNSILITKRKKKTKRVLTRSKTSLSCCSSQTSVKQWLDKGWMVKSLPHTWIPNTKPSEVIQNLMCRKKAEHENVVKNNKYEMTKVNLDVESAIAERSKILQDTMGSFKKRVGDKFISFDYPRDMCADLKKEDFETLITFINNECDKIKLEVEQFYTFLLELEKGRSNDFKNIFKQGYEELHEISYKLPYEIQKHFEFELLSVNQITLNNYRCYEELKKQIGLKIENDRRLYLQNCVRLRNNYEVWSAEEKHERLKKEKFEEAIKLDEISLQSANDLMDIEKRTKQLKELIEIAIGKIYSRDYEDLQLLVLRKIQHGLLEYDTIPLKNEIYTYLKGNKKDIDEETIAHINQWNEFLQNLHNNLTVCEKIFNVIIHLWDLHYLRRYDLRMLTIQGLQRMLENDNECEEALLVKFNILIDKLRQSSNEANLKQSMAEIKKYIANILQLINLNYERQCDYLKKHEMSVDLLIEVLVAEITSFLKKDLKLNDVDPRVLREPDQHVRQSAESDLILSFETLIKSLRNWLFGLKDQLENTIPNLKSSIWERFLSWVKYQQTQIQRCLDIKTTYVNSKLQRIYCYVYKIRLAEIKFHEDIMLKHKLAVQEILQKLENNLTNIGEKYKTVVEEYSKEVLKQRERVNLENISSRMKLVLLKLDELKSLYNDKRAAILDDYLSDVNNKICLIDCANLEYMESLILFSEGGNYNVDETNSIKYELAILAKGFKRDTALLFKQAKAIHAKTGNLLDSADKTTHEYVKKCYEELAFNEAVIEELYTIQNLIKETTYILKYRLKLCEEIFKKLKILAEPHTGSKAYVEEFTENTNYLKKELDFVLKQLLQANPFKFDPEAVKTLDNSDMAIILFGHKTEEDYISKIVAILRDSAGKLCTRAQEFYAGRITFEKEVIAESLKEFLSEFMAKFVYYQFQCEQVWMDSSVEYILLIEDVINYLHDYYLVGISKYVDDEMEIYEDRCKEAKSNIIAKKTEVENRYRKIHDKLKPLHGFPDNKHLLDNLKSEIEELNAEVINIEENLKEVVMKDTVSQFRTDLTEMENALKDNYRKVILNNELLLQIKEKIQYLQIIILSNCFDLSSISDSTGIFAELVMKLKELRTGINISKESLDQYNEAVSKSSTSTNKKISQESFMIEEVLIENYRNKHEQCQRELTEMKDLKSIMEKWNEFWTNDVRTVLSLYHVKYPAEEKL